MSIQSKLDSYTNAVDAVEQHIENNKAVFDQHQKMVTAIIDAENELRDEAVIGAENLPKDKQNVVAENGQFRVVVTRETQKIFNEDKIRSAGLADCITEQERPPRITISKRAQERHA